MLKTAHDFYVSHKNGERVEDFNLSHYNLSGTDILEGNILMYSLKNAIKFSHAQWTYLLKNSDITYISKYGYNALINFLDSEETIDLGEDNLDYLIQHSDLLYIDKLNVNILIIAFLYCMCKGLDNRHFTYLIDNSQLNLPQHATSMVAYALMAKKEGLQLSVENWKKIFKANEAVEDMRKLCNFFIKNNLHYIDLMWEELEDKKSFLLKLEEIKNDNWRYEAILTYPTIEREQMRGKIQAKSTNKINKI